MSRPRMTVCGAGLSAVMPGLYTSLTLPTTFTVRGSVYELRVNNR